MQVFHVSRVVGWQYSELGHLIGSHASPRSYTESLYYFQNQLGESPWTFRLYGRCLVEQN